MIRLLDRLAMNALLGLGACAAILGFVILGIHFWAFTKAVTYNARKNRK